MQILTRTLTEIYVSKKIKIVTELDVEESTLDPPDSYEISQSTYVLIIVNFKMCKK